MRTRSLSRAAGAPPPRSSAPPPWSS